MAGGVVVTSVTCTACTRNTQIPPSAIYLVRVGFVTHYSFRCPTCHALSTRTCTVGSLNCLRAAGVPFLAIREPAGAPPIDDDDLIRFGTDLHLTDTPTTELDGE